MTDNDKLQKYLSGCLSPAEKAEALLPPLPAGAGELLMSCRPEDYSASAIARAVEDCDVQLLALTVTGMRDGEGLPVVALRVGASDTAPVERSLRRYGYTPFYLGGPVDEGMRQRARDRAREILKMLEI